MTTRLVRSIEPKAISTNRIFVSLAEEIGVDPRTIRNVFDDAVQQLDQLVTFETPAMLGLDELHVLGAPRAILTNLEAHTIVEVLGAGPVVVLISAGGRYSSGSSVVPVARAARL